MHRSLLLLLAMLLMFITNSRAQMPVLTVAGGDAPNVFLEKMDISVQVIGPVATSTWTMTFRNNTGRQLEGELTFPMPEGVTVSRYAIDINGKLREAVPVDKARGTTVLEAIENRRVDPGLLERVEGNSFRTRIYPLPAGGVRTVVIAYEEELKRATGAAGSLRYTLSLMPLKAIPQLTIAVNVLQSKARPAFASTKNDIAFDSEGDNWTARKSFKDYSSSKPLSFIIPAPDEQGSQLLMQASGNHYYFLANTAALSRSRMRALPDSLTIVWDASLSGRFRNRQQELALLDIYFKRLKNVTVDLVIVRNTLQQARTFTISNGNWQALRKELEAADWDGGTQLGLIHTAALRGKEVLLFSDGISSFGKGEITTGNKPVYCIASSPAADYPALGYIAQSSGGSLIRVASGEDLSLAGNELLTQPIRFLGVKPSKSLEDVYPAIPVSAAKGLAVAGVCYASTGNITLQYGYGNTVTEERTISYNYTTQQVADAHLDRIWAGKKIADLDLRYDANRATIESLGRRYGLVTRNTSLIVLESVSDYLRYGIEPPAELRDEYDRAMKQRGDQRTTRVQDRLQAAENTFNELQEWWDNSNHRQAAKPVITNVQNDAGHRARAQTPAYSAGRTGFTCSVRNNRGEEIPGAAILLKRAGATLGTSVSDINGAVLIHPLTPGYCEVTCNAIGYRSFTGRVLIRDGFTTSLEIRMQPIQARLQAAVVTRYRRPIIDHRGALNAKSADEIDRLADQSTAGAVTLGPNVHAGGRGNDLHVGGGRATNNNIVVDGIQYSGSATGTTTLANTPGVTLSYNTGVPASYGNASGGVVNSSYQWQADTMQTEEGGADNYVAQGAIQTRAFRFDTAFINQLARLPKDAQYRRYLKLRESNISNPSFYFQVAAYFTAQNQKSLGLRVLSNLAELEMENYEVTKMLGYKLKEEGEWEAAVSAFRKVLQWRPMDPQSYRDYGLALADAGHYQQALDTLNAALTGNIDESLEAADKGIEETIVTEINNLITLHGAGLNTSAVSRKVLGAQPVDIRVVINWNMKNTDIDLWVTDPNNEKCFYSHKETEIGGRISADITQGFGPEQFQLRKAAPGQYKVEVNYYGDRQVKIAGPTTVMAEIYTAYGTPGQKRQVIVLQMVDKEEGGVYLGTFSFKR